MLYRPPRIPHPGIEAVCSTSGGSTPQPSWLSIPDVECSISGTLSGQLPNNAFSIRVMRKVGSGDLDSMNELSEPHALALTREVHVVARGRLVF
jgi:hypothetical protein